MHPSHIRTIAISFAILTACSTETPTRAGGKEHVVSNETVTPVSNPETAPQVASVQVYASVDEDFGQTPHTVKLTAEVKPGTGRPPFTFIWDFGDATEFSHEPSVTHVYADSGNYRASVKVIDASGDKDQDYVDLWILPPVSDEQLRDAMAQVQQLQMPSAQELQAELQNKLRESLSSAAVHGPTSSTNTP